MVEIHRGLQHALSPEYLKQQESNHHVDKIAGMKNIANCLYFIYRICCLTLRTLAKASRGSSEALSLGNVPITF